MGVDRKQSAHPQNDVNDPERTLESGMRTKAEVRQRLRFMSSRPRPSPGLPGLLPALLEAAAPTERRH
jgi:hypothetical protein